MNSGLTIDIKCESESIDKGVSEYLMVGIAIIKKYLPDFNDDPKELMLKAWQVKLFYYVVYLSLF